MCTWARLLLAMEPVVIFFCLYSNVVKHAVTIMDKGLTIIIIFLRVCFKNSYQENSCATKIEKNICSQQGTEKKYCMKNVY